MNNKYNFLKFTGEKKEIYIYSLKETANDGYGLFSQCRSRIPFPVKPYITPSFLFIYNFDGKV